MSRHRELVSGEIIHEHPHALVRLDPRNGSIKSYCRERKSCEALVRLKKFQIDNTRRRVAQIERMIADFDRMTNVLEGDIQIEQNRTGIHDPAHFAYPTRAIAMIARRDNLKRSIDELKGQLAEAKGFIEFWDHPEVENQPLQAVLDVGMSDLRRETPAEQVYAESDANIRKMAEPDGDSQ